MTEKQELMKELRNEIKECDGKQRQQIMDAISTIHKCRNSAESGKRAEEAVERELEG